MVRSKPIRAGTVYSVQNPIKITPRCMYCQRPVTEHLRPCWLPVPAQTTATTSVEEARLRSRRVLESIDTPETADTETPTTNGEPFEK